MRLGLSIIKCEGGKNLGKREGGGKKRRHQGDMGETEEYLATLPTPSSFFSLRFTKGNLIY